MRPSLWLLQEIHGLPEFFDLLAKQGTDYSLLLRELQGYWTDAVFLLQGLPVPGRSQEECEALTASVGSLQIEDLFRLIRLAATLEDEIKWSVSPRTRFEISLLRWVTLDRAVSIKQLMEQIASGAPAQAPKTVPAPTPAPVPVQSAAPTRSIDLKPPTPKAPPVPAAKAAPVPTQTAAPTRDKPLELDELTSSWSKICDALDKISSAASAFAHNDWEVVSLNGTSLTVRPRHQGKFHAEQLKAHSPSLEQAVLQVTGAQVKVSAAPAVDAPAKAPSSEPAPKKDENSKPGGDLFSSVMSQFGGEDVTSRMDKSGN